MSIATKNNVIQFTERDHQAEMEKLMALCGRSESFNLWLHELLMAMDGVKLYISGIHLLLDPWESGDDQIGRAHV